ncbi:glycosyltransferase [Angustibacter sp. McL0619]|uniref:glycosyltransferase n=1 Tax=Angustibacter sp. McL0619 TaxID=3415676 RepID=UPI003CF6E8EA
MRVAVVGPTYPLKGGVAAHTTELAHRLAGAGHRTELVSWSRLYPKLLYPGEQAVPGGVPDVPPFPATIRPLSWGRPDTWVRTGRSLRGVDQVALVHVVPAVVPAHLALLRSLGRDVPVTVIAHNVLPHEPHRGDERLVRALLRRAGAVLVHSAEQAELATSLGAPEVRQVALPPHLPGGPAVARTPSDGPLRLLALGMVREYKGTDLLIEALRGVPGVRLTVAGELWGAAGERVRRLATSPELADRVVLRSGYVPGPALAGLLAEHDVLALPYRSATSSQNAQLGFAHGLPVLATRTGTFAADVHDGVDGLLVEPDDVPALSEALRRLTGPGELDRLCAGIRPPDLDTPWKHYLSALLGDAGQDAGAR